tara:strand:- start:362 stop:1135 length:774 start_codon:yes stop_codon:yes gene_type:complete
MALGLMLHKGAELTTREEIKNFPTPEATVNEKTGRGFQPIPHEDLIGLTEMNLKKFGFEVDEQEYGITPDGNKFFGVMSLKNNEILGPEDKEFRRILGLRNAGDKSFASGLCIGSQVFVCDNMAFSGEIMCNHRHTKNILRNLPGLIYDSISKMGSAFDFQSRRIGKYKNTELTQEKLSDTVIELLKGGAINNNQVLEVIEEYKKPTVIHSTENKLWNLFNSVTERHKKLSPVEMCSRTQKLHRVLDVVANVEPLKF